MTTQTPALPKTEAVFNADKDNFAAADSLPPANTSLPTDEDIKNRNTQKETTTDVDALADGEGELDEETEIETPPAIEAITPTVNEEAKKAKDIVAGEETLEEFSLDNEEDTTFLKELGYGKNEQKEEATPAAEVKATAKDTKAIEAEFETKYAPVKAKAAELDSIISDPLIKAVIELRKAGKSDLNEMAKELGFINVEKMTDKEVIEHECKKAGLTPEETETEIESLDNMTPLQKKNYINNAKAKLQTERDEKLTAFTTVNKEAQALYSEAVKSGTAQLDELIPKMANKKFEGLLITPEMANSIKAEVQKNAKQVRNEKGQVIAFDIKTSVEAAVATLYKNEWKKALIELGRTMGADKALQARVRANKKVTTSGASPTSQESLKQTAEAVANEQWSKQIGKKLTTK